MTTLALCLLLATEAPLYQSDFATGPSGFRVQWTGAGRLEAGLDPTRPGPSGAPSWRTVATEPARGTIGVGLRVATERVWRITLRTAAEVTAGFAHLAFQCHGADGKQVDWLGLGSVPASAEWRTVTQIVEIPAACVSLNLLLAHENFVGRTWLADVRIEPFRLSPELAARLRPDGPVRWGATQYLRSDDPLLRDFGARLLVAAGVTHTRLGVDWRRCEPERGRFDFSSLDRQLADLAHFGATAEIVFIHGTPTWASGKTVDDMLPERRAKGRPWTDRAFFPPTDWADWETFLTALATHFKGRVPIWEIMNEPDLWSEGFNGTYNDYLEYLRRACLTLRRVDPAAKVYTAAFVFDEWLPRLLADGAAAWFDGVCAHPYHSQPDGTVSRMRKLQFALAAADALKPVAITEIGYQAGGWREGPGVRENEAEKAVAGGRALRLLADTTDFIVWYTAIEKGAMYGLLRDRETWYEPTPMYFEMGRITGRLPADSPLAAAVAIAGDEAVLTVTNRSPEPREVTCRPVAGPNLGLTIAALAAAEWRGTLPPGATRRVTLPLRRGEGFKESAVGLIAATDGGNAVAVEAVR